MFNAKEKKLLQFLLQHRGSFVTSMELAAHLSCSDRTVRNHLKSIMKTLEIGGVELLSKQGQGYQLEFSSEQAYRQFIQEQDLGKFAPVSGDTEIEDRYTIILNKLLFEQEPILFDDLADELYVSRSTLSHDFKKIRQLLSKYDLVVESRANKGVYVCGKERDKRRFIMNHFLGNQFLQSLHQYIQTDQFGDVIDLENLTKIVLEECREGKLSLSDFVIQNLVVHISLAVKRIKEGFQLSDVDWKLDNVQTERQVAKRILERVQDQVHLVFPEQEIDYITLHLISKGQTRESAQNPDKEEIRQDLLTAIQKLGLDEVYHFTADLQLIEGVVTHLVTLQVRLANHIELTNPLLADIQSQYSDVFYLTKEVLQEMTFFAHEELTDDEVAYVTLHFMAAMERYKESRKFKVLAICATGLGAAQMLKNRLKSELGNRIQVVDVIGYYEISPEKLIDIDFIVSAVDLSDLFFNIPVFTVSVFLKPTEVEAIKQAMDKMVRKSPKQATAGSLSASTDFQSYFSKENFCIFEEKVSKDEVLRDLADRLSQGERPTFTSHLLQLMADREEMSSVVFSEKIAVPHPVQALAGQAKVAVAICKQGLAWDENSNSVQIVFLLSPSIYGNEGLSAVTQKIVRLTENDTVQEQLINSDDFTSFMKLLKKV